MMNCLCICNTAINVNVNPWCPQWSGILLLQLARVGRERRNQPWSIAPKEKNKKGGAQELGPSLPQWGNIHRLSNASPTTCRWIWWQILSYPSAHHQPWSTPSKRSQNSVATPKRYSSMLVHSPTTGCRRWRCQLRRPLSKASLGFWTRLPLALPASV